MSGSIRQSLPSLTAALSKQLKKAADFEQQNDITEIPSERKECLSLLSKVDIVKGNLDLAKSKVQAKDTEWQGKLDELGAKDSDEYERYEAFAHEGSANLVPFCPLVEEADEMLTFLSVFEKRLVEEVDHIRHLEVQSVASQMRATAQPTQSGPPPAPTIQPKSRVNLPKLILPKFSGKVNEWPRFQSLFKSNVDSRTDLTGAEKLSYLVTLLEGEAAGVVDGLEVVDASYAIAFELLERRYDRALSTRLVTYIAEFKQIPPASKDNTQKRLVFDKCERLFRQIEAAGDDISNNRSLALEFLSKFPPHMIRDLDAHHQVNVETPLKDIRETVFNYIMRSEIVSETIASLSALHPATYSANANKSANTPRDQKPPKADYKAKDNFWNNPRDYGDQPRRVETSLFSQAQNGTMTWRSQNRNRLSVQNTGGYRNQRMQQFAHRRPLCCAFCKEVHIHSRCPNFATASSRRRCAIQLGRCTACLGRKHAAKDCRRQQSFRICYYCRREHPSALCPITFPEMPTGASGSDHGLKPKSSTKPDSAKPSEKGKSVTFMTKTPIKQSKGKSMLMTAWCSLVNPKTGESIDARVILDSGSSRDYITEQVARRLKLQPESTEHIGVNVFGSGRAVDIKSSVVSFGLKFRDGSVKVIDANTTPLISNASVLPNELSSEEKAALEPFVSSLADKLDDSNGHVDVLLGAGLFWDIITGAPYRADSDIKLIPSKLGILLAGTLANSSPNDSSLTTFLCLGERSNVNGDVPALSILPPRTKSPTMQYVDEFNNLTTIGIADDSTKNDNNVAYEKSMKTIQDNDKDNRPTLDLRSVTDDELAEAEEVQHTRMQHSFLVGVPRDDEVEPVGIKKIVVPERFASLKKVLRSTVLVLKFIKPMVCNKLSNGLEDRVAQNTCVGNVSDRSVCADDILVAAKMWVRSIQGSDMKGVIEALARRKRHKLVKSLGLELDEEGIIRSYGRFTNSALPMDVTFAKLLPSKGRFTKLVVLDVYYRLYHIGEPHKLSQLRREFWIPWGRRIVRTALRRCSICRRYDTKPYSRRIMPPYPNERITRSSLFQFIELARVIRVVMSSDGVVRSAGVFLLNQRAIRRSVAHLYPLEVSTEEPVAPDTSEESKEFGKSGKQFVGFPNADILRAAEALNRSPGDISTPSE